MAVSSPTVLTCSAVQALQKLVRFGPAAKVTLQAASFNSLMPAQYQTHERLLAQVRQFSCNHTCIRTQRNIQQQLWQSLDC